MQDRRKQFFFWLGVFVLPLFWSWFTLAGSFTRRERLVAFLWLAVFIAWLFQARATVLGEFHLLAVTYPVVLGWLAMALLMWLIFRLRFVPTLIESIILIDLLAVLSPSKLFQDRIDQPFDWMWLAAPTALAMAHVVVEPLNHWLTKLKPAPPASTLKDHTLP
ncbi:hypothetical protein [Verrucomicrobium sp. BvORR106]|uniref:hypothetical protein n=1 Tax=Verrucomicrobium sp. BvORR106 TaxID=1403819 RepID=UPI00056E9BDD|nr:hypothetical protein [Verrucomicrobium sp. BvORR106]